LSTFTLSLLPRWRGAVPIHRALQAAIADRRHIMQMEAGLDTGPMLPSVTRSAHRHNATCTILARNRSEALPRRWTAHRGSARVLSRRRATYAGKLQGRGARLTRPLNSMQVRAFNHGRSRKPAEGQQLRIWEARHNRCNRPAQHGVAGAAGIASPPALHAAAACRPDARRYRGGVLNAQQIAARLAWSS
jgi:methionyl-tRNA formyltransferase